MRSPHNSRTKTKQLARSEVIASANVIRGYLAETWDGKSQNVKVRLNSIGGPAVLARSSLAGKLYTVLPVGTSCTLRMNRGTLELMSVDLSQQGDTLSTAMRGLTLTRSSDQTIPNGIDQVMFWTVIEHNDFDYVPKIVTTAFPSGGTVSKGTGSSIITGSGTKFMDDLELGDVIRIPGGDGMQYFSVVSIVSHTSLTVVPDSTSSASGQVGETTHGGISIPHTGWWFIDMHASLTGSGAGAERAMNVEINGVIYVRVRRSNPGSFEYLEANHIRYLQQYDLVTGVLSHDAGVSMVNNVSGGTPNLTIASMAGL